MGGPPAANQAPRGPPMQGGPPQQQHQQQRQQAPPRGPPAPAQNRNPEETDSKTSLNHFCQRYVGRPVTKFDIVYTLNKYGMMYQAIVTLNCINGEQYAGESRPTPKEAEQAPR